VTPTPIALRELLDRYAGVLLDVYGVLLDARGPLPGSPATASRSRPSGS
jgi:ribonucleotide monophosphatase NagD (HAD superfamily)